MPFETHWVPDPSDASIPVHKDIPEGFVEGIGLGVTEWRSEDYRLSVYRCDHCEGYVEGHPNAYGVNSLSPLSGRCGTEFYCARCGDEIGFVGMMS